MEIALPASRGQERSVLEAGKLPRHLHVRPVAVGEAKQRSVPQGPAPAGLEVPEPVDLGPELGRPGAEQVEAMGGDLVGTIDQVGRRLRLEARDGRQRSLNGPAEGLHRVEPAERRGHLTGTDLQRAGSEPDVPSQADAKPPNPAERGARARSAPERESLPKPDSQPAGTRPATHWSCQALTL